MNFFDTKLFLAFIDAFSFLVSLISRSEYILTFMDVKIHVWWRWTRLWWIVRKLIEYYFDTSEIYWNLRVFAPKLDFDPSSHDNTANTTIRWKTSLKFLDIFRSRTYQSNQNRLTSSAVGFVLNYFDVISFQRHFQ